MKFQEREILPLSDGNIFTGEGCATMSDASGNLLFYTDGSKVYNRNHQYMLNGLGLKGNSSSTQSAIIIPYPDQVNKYIIFTVGADDYATINSTLNEGFNYYVVDMALDGGLGGAIVPENNNLLPLCSEKIAAVKHINRHDYWVVTHYGNKFYSYLITNQGVNVNPVISQIGPDVDVRTYPVNSRGYLKISPDGKKLAIAHLSNLNYDHIPFGSLPTLTDQYYPGNGPFANAFPGYLGLYQFNKGNGRVSNEIILDESGSPYGVEFSPNNNVLYANIDYHEIDTENAARWLKGELVQYNLLLNASQIARSKRVIHTYRTQDTPSTTFTARGALQMALDQKIYYSREYKDYLSCIQQPDNLNNPMFVEVGYRFPYATYNVNTRYGLPPFLSSSFVRDIKINDTTQSVFCFGESLQFHFENIDEVTIISYRWDFGTGDFSTEATPNYIYSSPGNYTIRLTINSAEYGLLYYDYQITILDSIVVNEANLYACDYDLDGHLIYNLADANLQVSSRLDVLFLYFKTLEDAQANRNSINSNYISSIDQEQIYVRVINEQGCFQISKITLFHQSPRTFLLNPISICVYETAENLSLRDYDLEIENLLSDESILNITYYSSLANLYNQTNSITNVALLDVSSVIYARIEYFDKVCNDVIELTFNVSHLPIYSIDDVFKCKEDVVLITAPSGYNYEWIGLFGVDLNQDLSLSSIQIKNEGNYAVKILNEFGCARIIEFSVLNYSEIIITDVFVDQNNSIVIQAIGEGLSYSIDGINWFSENVIVGLGTGIYSVYIRNMYGCQVAVNEIYIFKWTNFLSPNMDNVNRYWEVNGLEKYNNVEVKIFNRFGVLLVDKVMNCERVIWNGKHNGKIQPSDSYWYIVKIPGYVKYSGFVLLKNKI